MPNKSNKLEGPFLINLRNKFNEIAGDDKLIDRNEFQEGLEIENQNISNRIFDLFDLDKNGTIDSYEFLSSIEQIINGTEEQKIRFAFDIHDVDGNGVIDRDELRALIEQSFDENNLDYDPYQLEFLVDEYFERADVDNNGKIDFYEFLDIAKKNPDFMTGFSVSPVSWLNPDRYNTQFSTQETPIDRLKKDASLQVEDLTAIQWLLIPRMIYLYNILFNRKKNRLFVKLKSIHLLPSKTVEIVIGAPKDFVYNPGDYIYINCPEISKGKWYPFNIIRTSEEGDLVLNVRANNHWSDRIFDETISAIEKNRDIIWNLRIDGPYGSASNRILRSEHAILVGAGYGVSKIAPILQDIAVRYKKGRDLSIKKIDLFWLIRDENYFQWFNKLLSDIEFSGDTKFFNYNIYFIDKNPIYLKNKIAYIKTDIKNNKTDMKLVDSPSLTSRSGMPEWDKELAKIKKASKSSKQDLFFSGPNSLKGNLQEECLKKNISFIHRKF